VKPNSQRRQLPGSFNCISGESCSHHKACGGKHSPFMSLCYGLIDSQSQTEIIGGDYQSFQRSTSRAPGIDPWKSNLPPGPGDGRLS